MVFTVEQHAIFHEAAVPAKLSPTRLQGLPRATGRTAKFRVSVATRRMADFGQKQSDIENEMYDTWRFFVRNDSRIVKDLINPSNGKVIVYEF